VSRLVLASASPRRRDLLSLLGVPFEVRPVDVVEEVGDSSRPEIVARRLAREKAEAARLRDRDAPILAADTVVVYAGEILGKPRDDDEARATLRRLRGRWHEVITGIVAMAPGRTGSLVRHAATSVLIRYLGDDEIEASIARCDPFDKAGAYAIQDPVLAPVEAYEGCYCNVVGLPLWPTIELLGKAGSPVDVSVDRLLPQCAACPLRLPTT
jgi:nucleoside triphosphate pyrophosphatase